MGLSRTITPIGRLPPWMSRASISVSNVCTGPVLPVARVRTLVSAGALALRYVRPPSVEYWKSIVVANCKSSGGQVRHGSGSGHSGGHSSGGMRWMNQRAMIPFVRPGTAGNKVSSSDGLLKLPTGGSVLTAEKTSFGV